MRLSRRQLPRDIPVTTGLVDRHLLPSTPQVQRRSVFLPSTPFIGIAAMFMPYIVCSCKVISFLSLSSYFLCKHFNITFLMAVENLTQQSIFKLQGCLVAPMEWKFAIFYARDNKGPQLLFQCKNRLYPLHSHKK